MNPDWFRNCDPGQMRRSLDDSYDSNVRLRAENARLRAAVELAIAHIDGKATKFSEREPIAVLQQLAAALVPVTQGW